MGFLFLNNVIASTVLKNIFFEIGSTGNLTIFDDNIKPLLLYNMLSNIELY